MCMLKKGVCSIVLLIECAIKMLSIAKLVIFLSSAVLSLGNLENYVVQTETSNKELHPQQILFFLLSVSSEANFNLPRG